MSCKSLTVLKNGLIWNNLPFLEDFYNEILDEVDQIIDEYRIFANVYNIKREDGKKTARQEKSLICQFICCLRKKSIPILKELLFLIINGVLYIKRLWQADRQYIVNTGILYVIFVHIGAPLAG